MKIMRKNLRYSVPMTIGIMFILISMMFLSSCKDFLNPEQEINVKQEQLFDDWYEYRSVSMGLYGLQQKLVEQLVVLGELRGDLLTVTPNADADLVEIYNFKATKTNKYANPTNFYKLISACNSFIGILKERHPEVLDKSLGSTNYDKLYGEALCMRAWAYFNAVRIYGKVPVIYESLTSVEEVEKYLNSTSYIDSVHYVLRPGVTVNDGYPLDTTYTTITLNKQFYNVDQVISVFTKQLEEDVKAVGVNHYMDNNDKTWEVTVWNTYAYHALLGQMYLTSGDFSKSANHLNYIAFTTSDNYRYQLGATLQGVLWRNIFKNIDITEDIYALRFDKASQQQNDFQRLFDDWPPHQYMLKPTKTAVHLWETLWRGYGLVSDPTSPFLMRLSPVQKGTPGDSYRGYGTSYIYANNGAVLPFGQYFQMGTTLYVSPMTSYLGMLNFKAKNDVRSYTSVMEGYDTIVYKYSVDKTPYDQDANFIIYRAGGIQLYLAEIYTRWAIDQPGGFTAPSTSRAINIVNDGSVYNVLADRAQKGIRGRAGYLGANGGIEADNLSYSRNPFTNEVTGVTDRTGRLDLKQLWLEEQILDERARELAFEGERFYDLMRVAERRNDPSFLAKKVSAKYPSGQREAIYNLLLNKKNWYINVFD
ncbi:MAG TPA: RagB/SusD family nutrient uptake outer membrane protein [Prolixibacteraceae bacterium]|jgi:hypothetical protein